MARTVVVAVTDAYNAHRALPLWAKLLLALAFAVTGWLLSSVLGGCTASADEATSTDDGTVQPSAQQPGLLGLLDTTLNTTVSTVTNTVHTTLDTTVTTLVTTVNQVTTQVTTAVTDTTTAVVTPVTTALTTPVSTAETTSGSTAGSTSKDQTKAETATSQATTSAPVVAEHHTEAEAPAVETPPLPQTVKQRQPAMQQPVRPLGPKPTATVQPRDNTPAPVPTAPAGQVCGVSAAHDGGNHSKHPFAILGAFTGTAPPAAIGTPRRDVCEENSRDAALPTTSPD